MAKEALLQEQRDRAAAQRAKEDKEKGPVVTSRPTFISQKMAYGMDTDAGGADTAQQRKDRKAKEPWYTCR